MQFDFATVLRLCGETLRDPAAIAAQIKAQRVPHEAGWLVLGAATLLLVSEIHLVAFLFGATGLSIVPGAGPLTDVIVVGAASVVMIFVYYYMGRAMGGTGSFGTALNMLAWFQVISLFFATIQIIGMILLPGLAGIVSLVCLGLQLWVLVSFLNVLHGFDSMLRASGLLIFSIFGLAFGLTFIVLLIGGAGVTGGS